jgi:hypothetical protein
MAFQQILLGSNKMVPDLAPAIPEFALFMTFARIASSRTDILRYLRKDFYDL